MNNWNTIQNELSDLNSGLAAQKTGNAYAVPDGYFENFANSVLQRLKGEAISVESELSELSPLLAGISKKMPFAVPEGYFEAATDNLDAFMSGDELPEILQNTRAMPYQVPAGYFDELPAKILAQISQKHEGAKVISIAPRRWMRLAAAAVVMAAIALSSILYFNNKPLNPASQSQEWVANKLKNVSNKDIEEFINTTDVSATAFTITEKNAKTDVRRLLNDVPDKDLDKFLDEIPADGEESLLIN